MDFCVYSRQMIELIKPYETGHLIISIRTPGDPKAVRLPTNKYTCGVFHLQFHDIIASTQEAEDEVERSGQYILFNEAMAKDVLLFVVAHVSDTTRPVENILVHCDAGVSRSPAIAAGLSKTVFAQDDDWLFKRYHPNRRVYRCLLNAYAPLHIATTF
jgi:predicted protein tyrosine phosphatase